MGTPPRSVNALDVEERLRGLGLWQDVKRLALAYGVRPIEVVGRLRTRSVAAARIALYERLRNVYGKSGNEIARIMGRDPTTVTKLLKARAREDGPR